jgi:hypothetical protein
MCRGMGTWVGNRGMSGKFFQAVLTFLVILGLPFAARAVTPPSVSLTPSVASPQMLGTPVTWTAKVLNATSGHTYDYQFSVTLNGQTQIVSDFALPTNFNWVPHTVEGTYAFNLVVRDITSTPYSVFAPVSVSFTMMPWVTAPMATGVVNPTSHPMIALFSGPPCGAGHQMLVRFRPTSPAGSQNPDSMTTNLVPCSKNSANFYVGGMYPTSAYLMHWEEYAGTTLVNMGSDLPFTTGALPAIPNSYQINVPAESYDATYPVALFESITGTTTATDLSGNILWYFPNDQTIARIEPGGLLYGFSAPYAAIYDLAGNLVERTNVEILNEQLVAKGYPTMVQFNTHEFRNLPDGNLAVLGSRFVVSTSAQGGTPSNPVNIVGDMVLVLDHNLQLVWAWDSFAHEDVNRAATDGDFCSGNAGCSTAVGPDWLHTNALQGTVDGNIILSQRSQDWVIKINYARGKGDGSVIWHMGAGDDFTIVNPLSGSCAVSTIPGDPNVIPWFTHQHDAHFDYQNYASGDGSMIMTIFDDGNTRHDMCPGTQDSRGMVLLVNEPARQIYVETVADLGGYSLALGSAQLLTPPNGNLYASFDSGYLDGATETQVSEVNLAGDIVFQEQLNQPSYRVYRMPNLDTTTEFETSEPGGIFGALPAGQPFDYSAGFAQDQDAFQFNGPSSSSANTLELTDGGVNEASSVFYGSPLSVQRFTTDFTFQQTNAAADGFTFTIQNAGLNALGSHGGGLGYEGIGKSVAIKFDLHDNSGEGSNSTGLYVDGAAPTVPAISLPGALNLHSGDPMDAHFTYDGTTLNLTLTDLTTLATFTQPFTIDIPATVGGSSAYFGFTGGTGELSATQQILSWSYEPLMVPYGPSGFPSGAGLSLNGSAAMSGSAIELTNGTPYEAGSAFFTSPVNVQSFNSDFNFQLTSAAADGFTFTIQNAGPTALGHTGGGLGYAGIPESVAIKFDLFSNAGEGSDSTGLFTDGAPPTVPSIDLTGTGINLHSGDMMHAHLSYDGNALTLTITDLATNASWTQPFAVDIPTVVGGTTAYVGFTAGSGSMTAVQQILNWTFE